MTALLFPLEESIGQGGRAKVVNTILEPLASFRSIFSIPRRGGS